MIINGGFKNQSLIARNLKNFFIVRTNRSKFVHLIFQLKIFENDNLNKIVKLDKSFLGNVILYVPKVTK